MNGRFNCRFMTWDTSACPLAPTIRLASFLKYTRRWLALGSSAWSALAVLTPKTADESKTEATPTVNLRMEKRCLESPNRLFMILSSIFTNLNIFVTLFILNYTLFSELCKIIIYPFGGFVKLSKISIDSEIFKPLYYKLSFGVSLLILFFFLILLS